MQEAVKVSGLVRWWPEKARKRTAEADPNRNEPPCNLPARPLERANAALGI